MMSALSSSISTVFAISEISPPKIQGIKGDSGGSVSTLSHEYVFLLVSPEAGGELCYSKVSTTFPHQEACS